MKKNIIIFIVLAALLPAAGCSRGGGSRKMHLSDAQASYTVADADDAYIGRRPTSARAELVTEWKGTGYNPEGAGGVEGPTPAPLRGMYNLYGNMTQSDKLALSEEAGGPNAGSVSEMERKLVKSANIRIRVENLEAADASISDLLTRYEAYSASTYIQENSYSYSLRVPSHQYDVFLAEMNGMGRMLSRSENTEDVTLRYYDLEGRLATKRELLKTYQSYLGRASRIEDLLSVESRIADLQYDIESTGTQLRNLANKVDYATIDLNLLGPVTVTPNRGSTLGERVKEMFSGFGGFLAGTVIVILSVVIYGIPILLLAVLFFWLLFGKVGLLKKLWRMAAAKKVNSE